MSKEDVRNYWGGTNCSAADICASATRRRASSASNTPTAAGTARPVGTRWYPLAAQAAASHTLDEKTLRPSLVETARRSYGDGATVNQNLEEGWKQGIAHAIADWGM